MNKRKNLSTGSIMITLIFLIFIAMVGLSVFTFSIAHTRITQARSLKINETDRLYQTLIVHLHHIREHMFQEKLEGYNQPEQDYFNAYHFPGVVIDNRYAITHSFRFTEFAKPGYTKIRISDAIKASDDRFPYTLNAEILIDLLSGKVPLTSAPLVVETKISVPVETFLEENHITNKSNKNVLIGQTAAEFNISKYLIDSLKISATTLSWAQIRAKFHLPISDLPIPDGIYLALDNSNVESVVIQGNVDRLVFVADCRSRIQKIKITAQGVPYELSYKPGEKYVTSWESTIQAATLYKEKIIVNGDVGSIEQEGGPAFLDNSNISLFVTGKAIIGTNLETEPRNLSLKTMPLTNLKLSCAKDDLFNRGSDKSGVVVNKKDQAVIQATIITNGTFTNTSSDLRLTGSLACAELENNGTLSVDYLPAAPEADNYFNMGDFKYIDRFLIQFIEEITDANE
ncbi:MAG: hypothetical protein ACM3SY_10450 [Candidatus Omnitrophota bacterium]